MDQASSRVKPKTIWFLAGLVLVIALLVGGYFRWKGARKTPEEKAGDIVGESIKAAGGGVLPIIETQTNPLEKLPEINPVDKTNPFKDVKTNPFE